MPDAHFVYKRLISDARIKKSLKDHIKYETEEHIGTKVPESLAKLSQLTQSTPEAEKPQYFKNSKFC